MTRNTGNREQRNSCWKNPLPLLIAHCSLLIVICSLLFVSCLQSVSQGKFPEYIPSAQNIQSSSFFCDNNDLLIVTVSGAVLRKDLDPDDFMLTLEGKEIPVSNLVRGDDNCALLGFDSALPKSYDYRLTVKPDAVIPGDFSQTLFIKPVSTGTFTAFENTAFGNDSVNSLCYGNARFIAAGDNGKMAYLPDDGNAWIAIKPGEGPDGNKFIDAIYGIAGGNNRFYAVGEGARMSAAYNNGQSWSRPLVRKYNDVSLYFADELFSGDDILCVTWGKGASVNGGRFVAAGKNGKLLFEWDPDVWNEAVITLGEFDINTLVWGDTGSYGSFIAAGSGGNLYLSTNVNGRPGTWTATESRFDNSDIYCGAFGNGIFVIGGQDGRLAWSQKGDEWEMASATANAAASAAANADILDIAFGGGIFVAVGDKGFMAVSADGISWEAVTGSGFDRDDRISAIASDGHGKFVAAGNSRNDNKSKIIYWYQKPAL